MSKVIIIKLTKASPNSGPFTIKDQFGNIISTDVPKESLIAGISYEVNDNVTMLTLISMGKCSVEKTQNLSDIPRSQLASVTFEENITGCLWRHLTDITKYNYFYGSVEPYVIEYPFDFQPYTEILQSVQEYCKVYKYLSDGIGVFSYTDKIEVDNEYFNKFIVYNGQQSSGTLILVSKPTNNLHAYMQYPIYNIDSKTIIYTKSNGFYQINGFYDIVKDKTKQLFNSVCDCLSIDKKVNDDNMIYTQQSFRKSLLRSKDIKLRYILDNKSDIHIVSQFILTLNQISYK